MKHQIMRAGAHPQNGFLVHATYRATHLSKGMDKNRSFLVGHLPFQPH